MSDSDRAYDRLHGVDGHTQADPICNERGIPQSECPPFCPHDFGPVGPDGFTRLAGYVAEYVNDSPAALRARLTEAQWNALEMARKADAAERRAEEAEFHVEQLRGARDRAERRFEIAEAAAGRLRQRADANRTQMDLPVDALAQVEALAEEWEADYPSDLAACSRTADQWWRDLRAALNAVEGVGTGASEGATGQDTGTAWVTRSTDCPEAPAQAHPLADETECLGVCGEHHWLDRPESDTRECLICGTEAAG